MQKPFDSSAWKIPIASGERFRLPAITRAPWIARWLYLGSLSLLAIYYPTIAGFAAYDWLGLLAVVILYGGFAFRGHLPKLDPGMVVGASFLFIGSCLTILNAPNPSANAIAALLLIYTYLIWLSLPCVLLQSWAHVRIALAAIYVGVIISVLFAFGNHFQVLPLLSNPESLFYGRQTGLTRHPNELGMICGMAGAYPLALGAGAQTRLAKFGWNATAVFSPFGVLLSGSMSGALTLLSTLLVYYLITTRSARMTALFLGTISAIILLGFTALYGTDDSQLGVQRIARFLASSEGRVTYDSRLEANNTALDRIIANPLIGNGFQSRVETDVGLGQVHNALLLAMHEGGMFLMLGVIVFLLLGLRALWKTRTWAAAENDKLRRPYIAAITGSYVGFLVAAQGGPILYQRSSLFPMALSLALVFVIRRSSHRGNSMTGNVLK